MGDPAVAALGNYRDESLGSEFSEAKFGGSNSQNSPLIRFPCLEQSFPSVSLDQDQWTFTARMAGWSPPPSAPFRAPRCVAEPAELKTVPSSLD